MLIFATRYSRVVKTSPRYIRKRSYKNFNCDRFLAAIREISWLDLYLTSDVNTAVQLLSDKITFILDVMAPMRTIQVRTKYAPWLSPMTKELMKKRDQAQKSASESGSREKWKEFKSLRNTINNRLKFEQRNWQKLKLNECDGDPKSTWRNVKGILNWNTSGSPNQLFYKGKLISKPQELANAQNEFFIEKINTIRENMPASDADPLQKLKRLMSYNQSSFSLSSFPS